MALFGSSRDSLLIKSINRELIGRIVQQQIGYYKINLDSTTINLYGESNSKYYNPPVLLNCLINANNTTTVDDDLGPNSYRNVSFNMFRQDLIDAGVEPETGDIVMWNENYYEVDNTDDSQFWLGKNPDYSVSDDTSGFGLSISVIITTHWTNVDKLNIIQVR